MTKTFTISKRENAPDFVWGSFGCKPEDIKDFVNAKGYINFDILRGKEGGYYAKVSDYGLKPMPETNAPAVQPEVKPVTNVQSTPAQETEVLTFDENIPF